VQNNILRQITDIQVQANRLIKEKVDLEQISQFALYTDEMKSFLLQTIKDDFIQNHIAEIPNLNLDENTRPTGILILLSFIMGGAGNSYYHDKQKIDHAKKIIREIRNKYASIEFMLKNYFNS